MDHMDLDLVWSKSSSDETEGFYRSALTATLQNIKKRDNEERVDIAVQRIFQSITNIIGIYGVEEDKENVVIKYLTPPGENGIWTFDVRFSVMGKSNQVLAAAMSLVDAADRVNQELKVFVRGMEIERG